MDTYFTLLFVILFALISLWFASDFWEEYNPYHSMKTKPFYAIPSKDSCIVVKKLPDDLKEHLEYLGSCYRNLIKMCIGIVLIQLYKLSGYKYLLKSNEDSAVWELAASKLCLIVAGVRVASDSMVFRSGQRYIQYLICLRGRCKADLNAVEAGILIDIGVPYVLSIGLYSVLYLWLCFYVYLNVYYINDLITCIRINNDHNSRDSTEIETVQ